MAAILSRNGSKDDALKIYQEFDKALPRSSADRSGDEGVSDGEKLPPLVDSPQAGAAEALYGLGASIGRRGGEDLALVYLQLALYLEPNACDGAAVARRPLRGAEEARSRDQGLRTGAADVAAHAQCRNPARRRSRSRSIAPTRPRSVSTISSPSIPKDTEALLALGNILRGRKEYAACADAYGKAIDTVPKPEKANWVMFYFRGICYERSHQWPNAEADMKKALELYPDQPLVLNYLGYSWVDQGIHLDEGMRHDPPLGRAAAG